MKTSKKKNSKAWPKHLKAKEPQPTEICRDFGTLSRRCICSNESPEPSEPPMHVEEAMELHFKAIAASLTYCRDMYGFIVRPEHAETYKAFAKVYEVEEEERSARWEGFLSQCADLSQKDPDLISTATEPQDQEGTEGTSATEKGRANAEGVAKPGPLAGVPSSSQFWGKVRPSLAPLERALSFRVEQRKRSKGEAGEVGTDGRIMRAKSLSSAKEDEYAAKDALRRTKSVFLPSNKAETSFEDADKNTTDAASEGNADDFGKGEGDKASGTSAGSDTFGSATGRTLSRPPSFKRSTAGSPLPPKSPGKASSKSSGSKAASATKMGAKDNGTEAGDQARAGDAPGGEDEQGFSGGGGGGGGLRRAVSGIPGLGLGGVPAQDGNPLRRAVSGVPDTGGGAVLAEVFQGGQSDSANRDDTAKNGHDEDQVAGWSRELYSLVVGGVPMALRGELWQVFVGTKTRRKEGMYDKLMEEETDGNVGSGSFEDIYARIRAKDAAQQWVNQIEKDLQRTFPGHPALDSIGRDALRRVLIGYAKKDAEIGYCQGMNFLAGLLLLLMPEENAFWTLSGLMDDYLEGYYSDQMIEAQVDQLVFEELVRTNFPRLVSHLDVLGVQVTWVSGPWFLSLYVNVLPWDSVLRVWDVMLYEGNRSMLFRTGLALLEMHATQLMEVFDPGDAMSALQSIAGDWQSFDSSKLVLSACIGYVDVEETVLEELRHKHRPSVLEALRVRQESLARYQSVRSDRLAAEAKAALEEQTSPQPSPMGASDKEEKPAESPVDTGPRSEGAPRPEVLAALHSHRKSLLRHQSMKGENIAAETAAALAEVRSPTNGPAPLARLGSIGTSPPSAGSSSGRLTRGQSAPKWVLSQALGPGGKLANGFSVKGGPMTMPKGSAVPAARDKHALGHRDGSMVLEVPAVDAKSRADSNTTTNESGKGGGDQLSLSPQEAAAVALQRHRVSLIKSQSIRSEEHGAAVAAALANLPSPDAASAAQHGGSGFRSSRSRGASGQQASPGRRKTPLQAMNEGSATEEGEEDTPLAPSTAGDDLGTVEELPSREGSAVSPTSSTGGSSQHTYETDEDDTEMLQTQVTWLKEQLVMALEGQDAATLRVDELQRALVDMSRRLEGAEEKDKNALTAKIGELERDMGSMRKQVAELKRQLADAHRHEQVALADAIANKEKQVEEEVDDLLTALAEKEEKLRKEVEDLQYLVGEKDKELENLVQVMMRMQTEQKTTEDLRLATERQVSTQRQVIDLLVEKNKEASQRLVDLEKRALMAESMLQAFMAAAPAEASYSTFGGNRPGTAVHPSPRTSWGQPEKGEKRNSSEWSKMWNLLGYKEELSRTGLEDSFRLEGMSNRQPHRDVSSDAPIDLSQYGLPPTPSEDRGYSHLGAPLPLRKDSPAKGFGMGHRPSASWSPSPSSARGGRDGFDAGSPARGRESLLPSVWAVREGESPPPRNPRESGSPSGPSARGPREAGSPSQRGGRDAWEGWNPGLNRVLEGRESGSSGREWKGDHSWEGRESRDHRDRSGDSD